MSADTDFNWQPIVGDGIHRLPSGQSTIEPISPVASTAESQLPLPTAYSFAPPPSVGGAGTLQRFNLWVASIVQKFTLPEDGEPLDPLGKLVVATPPWMISMIVHFSLMILLGLLAFGASRVGRHEEAPIQMNLGEQKHEEKDEIYAEKLGEQLVDPSVKMSSDGLEPAKDAVAAFASSDLPEVENPLIGPPNLEPSPGGTLASGTVPTPAIGLEFSGRDEGVKKALLKAYGGTALTEDAVKEGLAWLARQQKSRGNWSLIGTYKNGAGAENEEAATAMALLAFQGAGHTPRSSGSDEYVKVTSRGWTWLLKQQDKDGHFFSDQIREQDSLYTQAMCTIALCELYGMTRDERYFKPAQKAVDYCVKIQAAEGGWRYQPGIDSDLSVTGWFSMAMQSARMAGLEVPSEVYAKISKFLDSVQHDEGARYAYQLRAGATLTLTAEGLLCRQYLGWGHNDQRLQNGVQYILANLPAWDKRNVYYWYYATQVCHHMEGEDWQKWNDVMRQLLPERQEKKGSEKGSWEPMNDRWGDAGGRLYVTCLSLYTLEVYYRHLPIYRNKLMEQ